MEIAKDEQTVLIELTDLSQNLENAWTLIGRHETSPDNDTERRDFTVKALEEAWNLAHGLLPVLGHDLTIDVLAALSLAINPFYDYFEPEDDKKDEEWERVCADCLNTANEHAGHQLLLQHARVDALSEMRELANERTIRRLGLEEILDSFISGSREPADTPDPPDPSECSAKEYSPKELRQIFRVRSQTTLSDRLNSQAIRNIRITPKRYRIHRDDLPE